MTTCMFECNNAKENEALSNRIWEEIRNWEEYGKKQVILCKLTDEKSRKYHVYLSIEDRVKASVSICFEVSDKTGKYYELKLVKDEEQQIPISVGIKAKIYYERPDYEDRH